MTITYVPISSSSLPPGAAYGTNVATNALRSGLAPHDNSVTIARTGAQTTGDTMRTAYTVTVQNSIGGITGTVTQQTGYSSTANGSDNLISLESVSGSGTAFNRLAPVASSPDTAQTAATTSSPVPAAPATQDNTNSPAATATGSTVTPPQAPLSSAIYQSAPSQGTTVQNSIAPPPVPAIPTASFIQNTPDTTAPTTTGTQNTAPQSDAATNNAPPANNGNAGNTGASAGGYTSLANASASTIRGGNLNVVT